MGHASGGTIGFHKQEKLNRIVGFAAAACEKERTNDFPVYELHFGVQPRVFSPPKNIVNVAQLAIAATPHTTEGLPEQTPLKVLCDKENSALQYESPIKTEKTEGAADEALAIPHALKIAYECKMGIDAVAAAPPMKMRGLWGKGVLTPVKENAVAKNRKKVDQKTCRSHTG